MDIVLLKQPGTHNLSGMPIAYTLALTGYGTAEKNRNIQINLNVMVEQPYQSGTFINAKAQSYYPDSDGNIAIDVKSIVDAYLSYYIPTSNQLDTSPCSNQITRIKLSYQVNDNGIWGNSYDSPFTTVMKGGISSHLFNKDFLKTLVITNKQTLNILNDEGLRPVQIKFLYWCHPSVIPGQAVNIQFSALLNDDTTVLSTKTVTLSQKGFSAYCTPVSISASGLVIPADKLIKSISVSIREIDATDIITPITFFIQYKSYYQAKQLFFINGFGALESLLLLGQIDYSADYTYSTASRVRSSNLYQSGLLEKTNLIIDAEENYGATGNTGYITKQTVENLRSLFLSKYIYVLEGTTLIPVVISAKNSKFYNNNDNLYNVDIQYQYATPQQYYTDNRLIQTIVTCPEVESLFVTQMDKNKLQISYSLPAPYDKVLITITKDSDQIFKFYKNSGSFLIDFANTAAGDYTISAQVICNEFSSPMLLGVAKTLILAISDESNPIANDINISGVSFGNIDGSGNANLETLAENLTDYITSPDNHNLLIEAVSVTTDTPTAKGKYQYNAAGDLMYASTPGASGLDYFLYKVKNDGGTGESTGRVNITLNPTATSNGGDNGAPVANEVFVKLVWGMNGYKETVAAYYYSDHGLTRPIDLTSKGITINYRWIHFTHGVQTGDHTDVSDLNILAVGTNTMIEDSINNYSEYYQDGTYDAENTDYVLLPGDGYVVM